jgi:hypothetical protein
VAFVSIKYSLYTPLYCRGETKHILRAGRRIRVRIKIRLPKEGINGINNKKALG